MDTGAIAPGTPGLRRQGRGMAPDARASRASVLSSRGRVAGQKSLNFWLVLVLYPFAQGLGTYPVRVGDVTVGAEFLLALVCAFVALVGAAMGRVKLHGGNRCLRSGAGPVDGSEPGFTPIACRFWFIRDGVKDAAKGHVRVHGVLGTAGPWRPKACADVIRGGLRRDRVVQHRVRG